jgi:hypothetical protein
VFRPSCGRTADRSRALSATSDPPTSGQADAASPGSLPVRVAQVRVPLRMPCFPRVGLHPAQEFSTISLGGLGWEPSAGDRLNSYIGVLCWGTGHRGYCGLLGYMGDETPHGGPLGSVRVGRIAGGQRSRRGHRGEQVSVGGVVCPVPVLLAPRMPPQVVSSWDSPPRLFLTAAPIWSVLSPTGRSP